MPRLILFGLLASTALVGCGGGGGGTTGAGTATHATSAQTAPSTGTSPQASTPAHPKAAQNATAGVHVALGSPSDVPRTKGGDNSIQDFGAEASAAERAAAGRVLTAYLRAYASGDAQAACSLLASSATDALERTFAQAGSKAPKGCAAILQAMTGRVPQAARRQLTLVRILSLRVQGDRAFAIYDAADGKAYAIPMARESGSWRVAGLAGSPLIL
jgi:hypothetical protein